MSLAAAIAAFNASLASAKGKGNVKELLKVIKEYPLIVTHQWDGTSTLQMVVEAAKNDAAGLEPSDGFLARLKNGASKALASGFFVFGESG
jgi:hypothetical protein